MVKVVNYSSDDKAAIIQEVVRQHTYRRHLLRAGEVSNTRYAKEFCNLIKVRYYLKQSDEMLIS
ncbi:hypothetical protein EBL_c24770 [Shimwellia blattae DSM 4481 = NBRC 105725]|uniref:Uncharacterized protein n=1 Tax=Shimwellia blattae (strain ATCC 29907 / DSM 4481 / JCM 1650 / NBRC 105725 / CDC 9005-74) TaxID=630626 RepID=I2BAK9_SHIBC|nr:hypothetical protein EBL_c24770 [Shimwellia blattae DSM 4481 = NBRC 105725]VDY65062.1 Uncharacterised protein [Shimwellia blattae]VEC23462.1 Uncharacterised protein [Shimwellia blattae]